jgi:hypothetical protein
MPVIEVDEGPSRGKRFRLPKSGTILVGRDERCALRLDDPSVAPRHCMLVSDGGPWRLVAGKAGASVKVNGKDTAEHRLVDGDLLRVGSAVLSFQVPEEDALVGKDLGGHRILRRLGGEPTGTVYLAMHGKLKRHVALTVLSEASADPRRARLLDEELASVLKLTHPNLTSVYDTGTDAGLRYVVTEHAAGGTLEKVLAVRGRLPAEAAVGIGIAILDALEYAERQGVVHGAIEPGKISWSEGGAAKLSYLGFTAGLLSEDRSLIEASPFLSPEQALGGMGDRRSDIYGLGATLYRSLAGAPPFGESKGKELLARKLKGDFEDLVARAPETPRALAAIVAKMLAPDAAERYGCAGEARAALEGFLREQERLAVLPGRRGLSKPALAAIAVLACVAAGVAVFLCGSTRDERPAGQRVAAAPARSPSDPIARPFPAESAGGPAGKPPSKGSGPEGGRKDGDPKGSPPAAPAPVEEPKGERSHARPDDPGKADRSPVEAARIRAMELAEGDFAGARKAAGKKGEPAQPGKAADPGKVADQEKPVDPLKAFPPLGQVPPAGLVTYREVDEVFDAECSLVPRGASWRFFPGTREPPGRPLQWTELDYDDREWKQGGGPIGYGEDGCATVLEGMKDAYTTVYARHVWEIEDPARWKEILLDLRMDDGCLAFLNGWVVGRASAYTSGAIMPFDCPPTRRVAEPLRVSTFAVDLSLLRPGRNALAIQGLNAGKDSSDFRLDAVLRGRLAPDSARDRKRLEVYDANSAREIRERHLAYFDGRVLDREGKHAEAALKFGLAAADSAAPEPWLRLIDSLCAAGKREEVATRLREALEGGSLGEGSLHGAWFHRLSVGLRLGPAELRDAWEELPSVAGDRFDGVKGTPGEATSFRGRIGWMLGELARTGTLRIDAGGRGFVDPKGRVWIHDCFYDSSNDTTNGLSFSGTDVEQLHRTERWFVEEEGDPPAYRIPLPCGDYFVTLHLTEPWFRARGERVFGIALEDRAAMDFFEPLAPGFCHCQKRVFRVSVEDGALDLRGIYRVAYPTISGLEIQTPGAFKGGSDAARIEVRPAVLVVPRGGARKLEVTAWSGSELRLDAPPGLTFTSSAPGVASVDGEGRVTGLSDGTATIEVRAGRAAAGAPVVVLDSVDLGEIVAGGNGVDRPPTPGSAGIRPDTGARPAAHRRQLVRGVPDGPRAVPGSDLIDSAFVISAERQAIHTGGLVYPFKPGDGTGFSWDCIAGGGEAGSGEPFYFYSTGPLRSGLGMHASSGITFDLDRLRQAHGAARVKYLFAFAGVTKPRFSSRGLASLHAIASTAGKVLAEWSAVLEAGNGRVFAGEIPPAAKYLTLAVGAAGNGDQDDLGCFAHAMVAGKQVGSYSDLQFRDKSAVLAAGETSRCRVTALLAPFGWRLDVTDLATLSSTNESVAKVTGSGSIATGRRGTAHLNARFENMKASMAVEVRTRR